MKKLYGFFFALLVAVAMFIAIPSTTTVEAAETLNWTIQVNKGTNVVTIFKKDGTAYKAMICSTGSDTPVGTFYTPAKYLWHELIGPSWGQYNTRITGGYLFHSVWYYTDGDKSSMSVSAYNYLGNTASHGCIRLLVKDAKWIYEHCALGTKVVIINGTSADDPLGKPTFTKINPGTYKYWDPTDPDPNNPYQKAKPSITQNITTIEYGSKVNLLSLVTVKDSAGNIIVSGIKTKGTIDTTKLGTYKVKYSCTDSLGRKRTKTFKFQVVNTKAPTISGAKNKSKVEMGTTVNVLKGVTAKSAVGTVLTDKLTVTVKSPKGKKVKVKNGNVKFSTAGTYKITYKVTDTNGKSKKVVKKYKVINMKVKLKVPSTIKLEYGAKFNARSYATLKSYTGKALNRNKNITIKGSVDTMTVGKYKIKYIATQNGKATRRVTKTVTVNVVNKKKPIISGTGSVTVDVSDKATVNVMKGVKAKTYTGKNITSSLVVYINGVKTTDYIIDTTKAGTYNIKYYVAIPNGKSKTVKATVIVTDIEGARATALNNLSDYFGAFSDSDYSASNWTTLQNIYNTAYAAIEAAGSEDEFTALYEQCVTDLNAVETYNWGPLV